VAHSLQLGTVQHTYQVLCEQNRLNAAQQQVANLPTPSPRASTPSGSDVEITMEDYAAHNGIPMGLDAVPGNADMLFDCIR
jgi:hypothetical protein